MKKFYKISSKGAITLPAELRKKFGLTPGGKLSLIIENGSIRIQKIEVSKRKSVND